MNATLTWTKSGGQVVMYTEATGRFTIHKAEYRTAVPYRLYDGNDWVRGFVSVKGAKWWAKELYNGRKPIAVRDER